MNIKYHATIGILGEIICPSHGLFFIGSIFPDFPLLMNEITIRKQKTKFDSWKVSSLAFFWYHFMHSLFITVLLFSFHPIIGLAHLIHIVSDWFTHTGRFAAMPLFPLIKYKIKFGKEILK